MAMMRCSSCKLWLSAYATAADPRRLFQLLFLLCLSPRDSNNCSSATVARFDKAFTLTSESERKVCCASRTTVFQEISHLSVTGGRNTLARPKSEPSGSSAAYVSLYLQL